VFRRRKPAIDPADSKEKKSNYKNELLALYKNNAKPLVKKIFPNGINGGTNPLRGKDMINLITTADIRKGNVVWEIGMGVPYFSVFLGYVTQQHVIATDIGKKFSL
jgi:tRNA A58 N-methylase Trm61